MQTADSVRLRAGHWPATIPAIGTVFVLQGRTEWLEKYAETIGHLQAAGYDCLSLDWRGQGRSQRLLDDPMVGHVEAFADYQVDLDRLIAYARAAGAPEPWHMVAHSMGGAIGLAALLRGVDFERAVFSGPMWGLVDNPLKQIGAKLVLRGLSALGQARRALPTLPRKPYATITPFSGNSLTTNEQIFTALASFSKRFPELTLGAPSVAWVDEAFRLFDTFEQAEMPDLPILTLLGSAEVVVSQRAIEQLSARMPRGRLERIAGAGHEVLLERDAIRRHCLAAIVAHLKAEA